jgi:hypothetical protein
VTGRPDWKAVAGQLAEAIRLTREYVGEVALPAVEGWSWFDATGAYNSAVLADLAVELVPPGADLRVHAAQQADRLQSRIHEQCDPPPGCSCLQCDLKSAVAVLRQVQAHPVPVEW